MNWFDNPRLCDATVYDMVLSEYVRGSNRARIQNLSNGNPPYTDAEVIENGIAVNINDLTHTRMMHDARTQFANGFLKTGYFARPKLLHGPSQKREDRSAIASRNWNKYLKRSLTYFEALRAKFGLVVLHGIAPAVWENEDKWCPKPLGVEDVLIPGETLLGFENLPFFAIRRSFTGIELAKLTSKEKRDPGWNMDFVGEIMEWMDEQTTQLRSLNWPDVWAPEKIAERMKEESGGFLAGDRAPRIDVFDIYGWDDRAGSEGWVRRMILDSWSEPNIPRPNPNDWQRKNGVEGDTSQFLFTSGKRKVAKSWQEILSFQFADLSAVFPAHYHSVRSLGWMLYAPCHLGSRLRCKFYESVLEALMMLYEVDNQSDAQNALKLNLINKGFIDKTIRPVKAQDRWQVNANLVELGLRDNASVISQNSAAWTQNPNFSQDGKEKTRFQVMAELQSMTALVAAALAQAYRYQEFEYREIFRRFCKENSNDPDVRAYRAECLAEGIPAVYLNDATAWDVEPERITGGGNKTLEMQIADWLMQNRPAFDPEPQRVILRDAVLAYTDDAAKAMNLVPEEPMKNTPATREAEHIAATIMQQIPVEPLAGENHIEIIEKLIQILAGKIDQGMKSGGMVSPLVLQGLQGIAQHVAMRLQMLAVDKSQAQRVKQYQDMLTKLVNALKGFAQRLQAQMKAQQEQGGNGQAKMDPKEQAKIMATQAMGQTKAKIATQSASQRTAQKKLQFEQKMQLDRQKHQMDLTQQHQQHQADLAGKDLEAASNIRRNRMTSMGEE